jgi:hypothetical protein
VICQILAHRCPSGATRTRMLRTVEPPRHEGTKRIKEDCEPGIRVGLKQPGGLPEISRGLSEAIPPETMSKIIPPRRGGTVHCRVEIYSDTPSGCNFSKHCTGGVARCATLNPRLISGTALPCKPPAQFLFDLKFCIELGQFMSDAACKIVLRRKSKL